MQACLLLRRHRSQLPTKKLILIDAAIGSLPMAILSHGAVAFAVTCSTHQNAGTRILLLWAPPRRRPQTDCLILLQSISQTHGCTPATSGTKLYTRCIRRELTLVRVHKLARLKGTAVFPLFTPTSFDCQDKSLHCLCCFVA